jgi:hypothetical protein
MAPTPDWRAVAAQIIYHAYPDSDLLPIDPPTADETIGAFKHRAEEAGDTLFLFLCREADEEINPQEYVDRLDRALRDIEAVRDALADLLADDVHRPAFRPRSPPISPR